MPNPDRSSAPPFVVEVYTREGGPGVARLSAPPRPGPDARGTRRVGYRRSAAGGGPRRAGRKRAGAPPRARGAGLGGRTRWGAPGGLGKGGTGWGGRGR